jgi:hypothetical protein
MAQTFREALGESESGGRYGIVNDEGYSGKYQWGPGRLTDYNNAMGTNYSMEDFLANPGVQEEAQAWHENDIMNYVFEKGLDRYLGKTVAGVTMTPEAMIAMGHLGGKSGMRQFIESGGEYNPSDSLGTSLHDYAAKFSTEQGYGRSQRLGGDTPLSYGSAGLAADPAATERERMDAIMSGFEMMTEGSPEYCPVGYVYDIVSGGCVPLESPRTSPRPRPAPERGAALQRFGLPSLA